VVQCPHGDAGEPSHITDRRGSHGANLDHDVTSGSSVSCPLERRGGRGGPSTS
jgi:hypothetical protein